MIFGNQEKSYLEGLLRASNNGFKAYAYEKVNVTNTVANLNPPVDARYALMKYVSDATGNSANYLEFNLPVTAANGLPISDGTVFDITDFSNLEGFNIIQSQAGTHTLYVQYYR